MNNDVEFVLNIVLIIIALSVCLGLVFWFKRFFIQSTPRSYQILARIPFETREIFYIVKIANKTLLLVSKRGHPLHCLSELDESVVNDIIAENQNSRLTMNRFMKFLYRKDAMK